MKKNVIVGIAIFLLVGGGLGFKFYKDKNPEAIAKIVNESPAVTNPSTAEIKTTPANIKVDVPVSGINKGVVEVGASGFNSFVVNIDNQRNWEMVSKKFGKSLAWEGFANADDIYTQLKDYIGDIAEKGVKGRDIHFVISSGAQKAKGIDKVISMIRSKGYFVNTVTADQEGKYALKAAQPRTYMNTSYVVDIGSGNTKISWYEGTILKTVEAPGAKYATAETGALTDVQAYDLIKAAISRVPKDKTGKCFIIGGVPFKLASEVRNGQERFTKLSDPDAYSAGDDVKKKSGLNIYRALVDGSGTQEFIFDWDANFTIGFLMSMN